MAKKVAVPNEETVEQDGEAIRRKKKRSRCCSCCITMLIVMAVIFVGAFIAGWILGDKFTKEYFDMSLGDTLGVVNDLYWTDDDDVVKHPYKAKDLDDFYSEIKRNILLKDDAEVDFDSALNAAINKYLGVKQESAQALNADGDEQGGDSDKGEQGGVGEKESDSSITDIFVNMIVEVLDRDHIDIERLNKYNADDPSTDEYIFNLNDKQLAAFINAVLKSVLKNAEKTDSLSDISQTIKLDKVVSLKQIRFTAKEEKNADGEKEVKAASADVTIWVGLQDCANQAIHKLLRDEGYGWAGGLVGWLGDVFLPENVYITLSIPLYGEDNKADFRINDMDAAEHKRAKKLLSGIVKLAMGNDSKSIDDVLEDLTEKIRPMLEKATDKMDFTEAGAGKIKMDLLDTVAKMASDGMAEGEELTKADFLYVLQALLSDKSDQLTKLQPYRYDNWYNVDGSIKYLETGDPANKIDYEKQLMDQIEQKYAIDLGENKNLIDALKMFGISLDGSGSGGASSDELLDNISKESFDALLNQPLNDIKLRITDRMLGATFAGQMSTLLKDNEKLEKLNISLEALTFVQKSDPEKSDHLYALLAVVVDLKDMLGSLTEDKDGLMGKLVSGLMPDDILLTVTVDITRDNSITKDKADFVINSCRNTDRVLATMEKLVPDINLESISNQISDMLNDMLKQMEDILDIELVVSTYSFDNDGYWLGAGDSGAIVMPDIFTTVTDMVFTKDGETESVVTPTQLQHVIRDLNNPANITPAQPQGYKNFIDQVFDKYYLNDPDPTQPAIEDFDALTAYMSNFKTDMLRVYGTNGVAHDTRAMSALKPTMNEDELLALLNDKMGGKEAIQSYSIVKVGIGDNTLSVTLSIELKDLLTDAKQVQKLINANELYATATFHTDQITGAGTEDDPCGYGVSLVVNVKRQGENSVMDSDTYGAMLNIVKFFASDFDIENQVKEFGVILYEQMQNLNTSIGGSAEHSFFTFTERGLELTDFFTFLALKMEPTLIDDKYKNTDIRATVQGLYGYVDYAPNDDNFKESDIMFNTPSDKGSRQWTEGLYGNTHLDVDFNGFIKQGVEQMANDGDVTVKQTMILAKGDDREDVDAVRTWLNKKLKLDEEDDVDLNSDYLVITFSMAMRDFVGEDTEDTNGSKQLFPTEIYATVVYKYDDSVAAGSKFSVVGGISEVAPVLVFNNMDSKQYEIMVRLMGANPDDTGASDENKVNIKSIAKKGAEVLNGMSHYEYTIPGTGNKIELDTTITFNKAVDEDGNDEPGMGKIYISKPSYTGGLV